MIVCALCVIFSLNCDRSLSFPVSAFHLQIFRSSVYVLTECAPLSSFAWCQTESMSFTWGVYCPSMWVVTAPFDTYSRHLLETKSNPPPEGLRRLCSWMSKHKTNGWILNQPRASLLSDSHKITPGHRISHCWEVKSSQIQFCCRAE